MDIEKLIEDLRGLLKQYGEKIPYGELVGAPWPYSRAGDLVWQDPEPYFIEQAATALSTLQDENESLKEKLYDGEGVNLVDYWMQQAKIEENGHRNCQAENEKLRAEVESLKKEHCAGCSIPAVKAEQIRDLTDAPKLRAELEQVKAERDALIEDFVDYVTGGVPNPAIFCKNKCSKCVDMRGWCTGKNCNGFYPSGASG